ncbi:MAG: isoprenylcysteine carboxylmethyltransferase family protein [Promethearchaeota archaeon]
MCNELAFRFIFLTLLLLTLGLRLYYKQRSNTHLTRGVSPHRWKALAHTEGKGRTILWALGMGLTWIAMILYLVALPQLSWTQLPFPEWLRWLGVSLCLGAIPFLVWVHRTLGKHWKTTLKVAQDHSLVTSGPYRRVRHPMYTVLITFNIGLSLISANLFVVIGFLLLILLTFARIPLEERMLLDQFGEEYRAYMQRTGRLLPRLRQKQPTHTLSTDPTST